jgi:hypothetical protein
MFGLCQERTKWTPKGQKEDVGFVAAAAVSVAGVLPRELYVSETKVVLSF